MAIDPISSSIGGIGGLGSAGGASRSAAPAPGFGERIADGLQQVDQLQQQADTAIEDVATGGDTSVHELMVATSKAQLGVEVLAHVRDRAVEAYQEIMRMQV